MTADTAATSSLHREPTELERNGCFSDDSWPLQVRFEVQPPAQRPPSCASLGDAYNSGFRDALSGQRFIMGSPVMLQPWLRGAESLAGRRPVAPERKACNAYRGSAPADAAALECCILGFRTGVPFLLRDIMTSSRDPEKEIGRRDLNCRAAFDLGMRHAQIGCEHDHGTCPPIRLEAIRYLGCFHLGFNYQASQCSASPQFREGPSAYLRSAGIAMQLDRPIKEISIPGASFIPGILPLSGRAESPTSPPASVSGTGSSSGGP